MRLPYVSMNRYLITVALCAALSACGGGTSGGMRPAATGPLPLPLPPGHGLADGEITVEPGQSMEHGNVTVSCPAGGQACAINVAADGSASYDRTGGMPTLRILPLRAGPGQNLSDAGPVFAKDETSTLKATLANPANVFPVLAANVNRHRGDQQSTELGTDFFVKSIRRNASGEYVIDYVLDGTDEQVTIPNNAADCPSSCRVSVNGRTLSFWSNTTDDDDMASFRDGLGQFQYLASHSVAYTPEDTQGRTRFVFGVRNEDLPMGTATYHGSLSTHTWETADPSDNVRQRISGTMRIVANFDMRALEGRVYRIRGTPPGSDTRSIWETSSFTLTNGRIVNGQFTATLTGVDSDPGTPLDESVRGFIGHVLGEFYGPNAEEVGGVVTATRVLAGTADDRVLDGHFGGSKTDRLTGVNDSEAVSVGFDRDDVADTMALKALGSPTVESTDDGYRITYMVDGQTQTLEFTESDFGANLDRPTQYSKTTNGTEYRLFAPTRSFYDSRIRWGTFSGVRRVFRPEHFDVNGFVIANRDASGTLLSVRWGRIVYGNRTMDMPTTGTASYDGGASILESPNDRAVSTRGPSFMYYRADAALSADFGSSAVTGNFTLRESRPGDGDYSPASGGLSFNAAINGNGLSATDLSGSGDLAGYSGGGVNGAFYGPEAAEVAGVFDAINSTQNKHLIGEFGAKKQ